MSNTPHKARRRRRFRIRVPNIRRLPEPPSEWGMGPPEGGVREPRRPRPSPPPMSAALPEPEPPLVADSEIDPAAGPDRVRG